MQVQQRAKRVKRALRSQLWMRPMMALEPTPTAMPAKRLSTKRMRLHLAAHVCVMIVICAPESTNTFSGSPLAAMST